MSLKRHCVVTLVHGTFASDAPWTQPESSLNRYLKQAFGQAVTLPRPFKWSGSNSHRARLAAADELAAYLRHLFDEYPDSLHFIVAHSHGGNVALYAMKDSNLRSRIAGIICLATPFICCRPRDINTGAASVGTVIGGLFACLTFIAILVGVPVMAQYLFGFDMFSSQRSLLVTIPMVLGWVLCGYSLPALAFGFAQKGVVALSESRLKGPQASVLDRLSLPRVDALPVFVLRYRADEARRYLAVLTWFSNVPFWSLAAFLAPYFWILNAGIWIASKTGFFGYVAVMAILLASIVMSPIWLAMVLIHLVLRRHAAGFGEQLAEGLLVRVGVQGDPPRYIRAKCFDYSSNELVPAGSLERYLRPRRYWRLLHSGIYEDARSLNEIVRILADGMNTVRKQRRSASPP